MSAEVEMQTRKTPITGNVQEKGEKVEARLGLACECTVWQKRTLMHHGLEKGYFKANPEDFPDHWVSQ